MNLQVLPASILPTLLQVLNPPFSSWPILRSFKMVCLTGLWARCSSGTVPSRPCFYSRTTYQCFASSRCNNVLYIISVLSLCLRANTLTCSVCTEKPLQNNSIFKNFQEGQPFSTTFHARGSLETRPVRTICCASPCLALEPWHVYLHPNVRVIVLPIAKSQCFLTNDGPPLCERA